MLDPDHYQTLTVNKSIPGCPEVCYDPQFLQLLHKYTNIKVYKEEYDKELLGYMMRYKNPSEHVVLLKTVLKARRNTPTTKANTIELMSEFVPWRLHHYPKELLLEQAYFILKGALSGFKQLRKSQGPFRVQDSMIGINYQSDVKVWLDQHFGSTRNTVQLVHPPSQQYTEEEMLKSIFECIYKHLNNEDARYLKEKLKKMGTLNFTRIFRMLRSQTNSLNHHRFQDLGHRLVEAEPIYQQAMEVVKKENLQVGSPLRLTHIYSISDANLQLSPTMEKFTEEVLDADFDQTNPIMAHQSSVICLQQSLALEPSHLDHSNTHLQDSHQQNSLLESRQPMKRKITLNETNATLTLSPCKPSKHQNEQACTENPEKSAQILHIEQVCTESPQRSTQMLTETFEDTFLVKQDKIRSIQRSITALRKQNSNQNSPHLKDVTSIYTYAHNGRMKSIDPTSNIAELARRHSLINTRATRSKVIHHRTPTADNPLYPVRTWRRNGQPSCQPSCHPSCQNPHKSLLQMPHKKSSQHSSNIYCQICKNLTNMPQKMVFLDPRTGNELLIDNTLRAIKHYHDQQRQPPAVYQPPIVLTALAHLKTIRPSVKQTNSYLANIHNCPTCDQLTSINSKHLLSVRLSGPFEPLPTLFGSHVTQPLTLVELRQPRYDSFVSKEGHHRESTLESNSMLFQKNLSTMSYASKKDHIETPRKYTQVSEPYNFSTVRKVSPSQYFA